VNHRLQSIVLGLMAGFVPLLLLDLARILRDAFERDGGQTSEWWSIACYLAVGLVVAWVAAVGFRDRAVPAIGAAVIVLFVLPTLPVAAVGWIPDLPMAPVTLVQRSAAVMLIGTFLAIAAGSAGRSRRRSNR